MAPERVISRWLKEISSEYISIDLESPEAMMKMDLTALRFPDQKFSLVYCSHVLEHIPDDAAAMHEMYRVLRPGGQVVIQVPIWRDDTYEDWSVTTPEGRLEHFMQRDHVRIYGLDIVERLRSAGFEVEVIHAGNLPSEIVRRQALSFQSTNQIFLCSRSPG